MVKAEAEAVKTKVAIEEGKDIRISPFADYLSNALSYGVKATDLDSLNPEMWFRRGNIYFDFLKEIQGAEEWALKCYKKAYELDPGNQIYRQKAEMLEKTAE